MAAAVVILVMRKLTLTLLALAMAVCGPAAAQDDDSEDLDTVYPDDESVPSVRCIRPKMIRATQIIDARNVLFHMRSKKVYRNVLMRSCRALTLGYAFSYNTTYGRVCALDNITILAGSAGGQTCSLGKFYLLSEEEVNALLHEASVTESLGIEKDER